MKKAEGISEGSALRLCSGLVSTRTGVRFTYEISWENMHARSIKTDTGWKISLDRGLDIFQAPTNRFDRGRVNQQARRCKPFEVTYLRDEDVSLQGSTWCKVQL